MCNNKYTIHIYMTTDISHIYPLFSVPDDENAYTWWWRHEICGSAIYISVCTYRLAVIKPVD